MGRLTYLRTTKKKQNMKKRLEEIKEKIDVYVMEGKKANISEEERSKILLEIEEVVDEADSIIAYSDYLRKTLRKIKNRHILPDVRDIKLEMLIK